MPTHRSNALVSVLLSTGLVVACSSNDGESAAASAAAAKRAMSAPATSPLTKSNGKKAYATSRSQESSGALNPFGGGSSGSGTSSSTRSLAIRSVGVLSGGAEAGTCADILDDKAEGTCPCDGGGELDYAVSDLAAIKAGALDGEVSMTFVMKGCSIDGKKLDGKMTMIQSSRPIIDKRLWTSASSSPDGDDAPAGAAGSELNLLWSAESLTDGSETHDFALLMQDGETCLKPGVDDGFYYVCIGGGGVAIHAKNGSFVCDFEEGECSGDAETGKILLEGSDDAGGSDDGGAGRADGGSSGDGMTCGAGRCQSGRICCFDEADTCADSFAECPE
ncbi:MAG: hypothetical protein KF782_09095 [Labilithrix sp.]|nr:hypothetical protein [Labilithrix sp.]